MKINKPRRDETQELIVVALGPLANIALLTVQLEPEFSKNVRQIVLLGGPFTVNGKVNPASKANEMVAISAFNTLLGCFSGWNGIDPCK
ncbi:hypothetical protein F2Q69_00030059 [Brassica cretica]|uniref:Inosine/uridine-preferring nucleoside hydrolase domain-containing protein n=1 Tax=Brassica cretica TaxID=69181 RepID=A0A8S9S114_BRACR|nr:hypothetical protein F2Q69_00030059 [Brassica cretica]